MVLVRVILFLSIFLPGFSDGDSFETGRSLIAKNSGQQLITQFNGVMYSDEGPGKKSLGLFSLALHQKEKKLRFDYLGNFFTFVFIANGDSVFLKEQKLRVLPGKKKVNKIPLDWTVKAPQKPLKSTEVSLMGLFLKFFFSLSDPSLAQRTLLKNAFSWKSQFKDEINRVTLQPLGPFANFEELIFEFDADQSLKNIQFFQKINAVYTLEVYEKKFLRTLGSKISPFDWSFSNPFHEHIALNVLEESPLAEPVMVSEKKK